MAVERHDALSLDAFSHSHRLVVPVAACGVKLRDEIELQIFVLPDSLPINIEEDAAVAV